jgi:hypothetical protein
MADYTRSGVILKHLRRLQECRAGFSLGLGTAYKNIVWLCSTRFGGAGRAVSFRAERGFGFLSRPVRREKTSKS